MSNTKNLRDLKDFLPQKPWASDNLKYGLRIFPLEIALKKNFIQLNSPNSVKFLTFDCDWEQDTGEFWWNGRIITLREWNEMILELGRQLTPKPKKLIWNITPEMIHDDFDVPPPLWVVENPENGHCHIIYALKTPVYVTEMAHLKPIKYLEAVRKAYTAKLKADPRYVGLISKNPFSPKWWVNQYDDAEYDLGDLAEYVNLSERHFAPVNEDTASWGRNCFILEHVRVRAYREIRKFWNKTYQEWFETVVYMCEEENAKFSEPLGEREVIAIAKSITRWTLDKITPEGFAESQRAKISIRWEKESRKSKGIELLNDGKSIGEVMEILDVSRRTVTYWKREFNEFKWSIKVKSKNRG